MSLHGFASKKRKKADAFSIAKYAVPTKECAAITDRAGKQLSRNELAGYTALMYSWQNPGGSKMMVMLQNGKVIQKSQFGLK
jgi:hypothetical protein